MHPCAAPTPLPPPPPACPVCLHASPTWSLCTTESHRQDNEIKRKRQTTHNTASSPNPIPPAALAPPDPPTDHTAATRRRQCRAPHARSTPPPTPQSFCIDTHRERFLRAAGDGHWPWGNWHRIDVPQFLVKAGGQTGAMARHDTQNGQKWCDYHSHGDTQGTRWGRWRGGTGMHLRGRDLTGGPEAVRQAVGGVSQSGWGRLLSVTLALA